VEDHTQVRPPARVVEPQVEQAPDVEAETSAPKPPRRMAPLYIGIAAAVLIAGAVTTAVIVSGTLPTEAAPEPTGSGDKAVIETLEAPEVGTGVVSEAGDSVTFEVSNPEPQDGDAFRWHLLSNPGATTLVAEGEAT